MVVSEFEACGAANGWASGFSLPQSTALGTTSTDVGEELKQRRQEQLVAQTLISLKQQTERAFSAAPVAPGWPCQERRSPELDPFKELMSDGGLYGASCNYAVGLHGIQGRQQKMEDYAFHLALGPDLFAPFDDCSRAFLACVLDGHGGTGAVQYVAERLPSLLLEDLARLRSAPGSAMRAALHTVDEELLEAGHNSGTTVNALMVVNNTATVINTGDCRCILYDYVEERAVQITNDHNLLCSRERERVVGAGAELSGCGGYVVLPCPTDGAKLLGVTKALGHAGVKSFQRSSTMSSLTGILELGSLGVGGFAEEVDEQDKERQQEAGVGADMDADAGVGTAFAAAGQPPRSPAARIPAVRGASSSSFSSTSSRTSSGAERAGSGSCALAVSDGMSGGVAGRGVISSCGMLRDSATLPSPSVGPGAGADVAAGEDGIREAQVGGAFMCSCSGTGTPGQQCQQHGQGQVLQGHQHSSSFAAPSSGSDPSSHDRSTSCHNHPLIRPTGSSSSSFTTPAAVLVATAAAASPFTVLASSTSSPPVSPPPSALAAAAVEFSPGTMTAGAGACGCSASLASGFVLECDPDVFSFEVLEDRHMVLLGCDGVFDRMSNTEACKTAVRQLTANNNCADAAREVTHRAVRLGSGDNVTALVLRFGRKPIMRKQSFSVLAMRRTNSTTSDLATSGGSSSLLGAFSLGACNLSPSPSPSQAAVMASVAAAATVATGAVSGGGGVGMTTPRPQA